jgi:hypothetical protein
MSVYLQAKTSKVAHVADQGSTATTLCNQTLWPYTVHAYAEMPAGMHLCRNCARVLGERDLAKRQVEQGDIPAPIERDELTDAAQALHDAWYMSNIDAYGEEGAGYDAEYAAQELRKLGWVWQGVRE